MADHDPLCPKRGLHPADEAMMAVVVKCRCEEYARVRADEKRDSVGVVASLSNEIDRLLEQQDRLVEESTRYKEQRDAARAKLIELSAEAEAAADCIDILRAERDAARALARQGGVR